ncbi:MAG: DUF881 domain-containing protein [Bifidobacteriaceae bacterium]|nr:DUF881 domain-containing protein [Bifidobacteriaceae bacterium]
MVKKIGKHGTKRTLIESAAVCVVIAITTFLLITNFRVNQSSSTFSDAGQIVEQRVENIAKLKKEVNELNNQVNTLNKLAGTDTSENNTTDDNGSNTVLSAVRGPGVVITLDDSPLWEDAVNNSSGNTNANDYVIHQQDIEAVVNALWAGGAEAMMIQDQRVISNSAVLCVGNVLLLQGKQYSPPYKISAIGPTAQMLGALESSAAIKIYKEYVTAFGLGWNVKVENSIELPESPISLQPLRYATVLKNDEEK